MRKLKVGDVLKRVKNTTTIDNNQRYKRVTIKMNHKGVSVRDIEMGINIGTKSQFFIREGQFLLSKIDARNGAFGIVPPEADGAIITGNFWAFDVNQNELNIDLFHIMTSLPFFDELSKKASSGTTNRQYLDEKKFLAQEITLPPIEEQDIFITHFKKIQIAHRNTLAELKTQYTLIAKLRSSILSDAVSGRLVPQESTDESASVLLERIKVEKEQLIKEKKIKQSKRIDTSITERDIALPNQWEWTKGDELFFITKLAGFEYTDHIKLTESGDIPVIRAQNVRPLKITKNNLMYIDSKTSNLLERSALIKPSLLVTFIGAGIGDVALFDEQERWHLAPNVSKMEPFNASEQMINLKYMNYYLLSQKGQYELFKHMKATAQPSLSMGTIRDIDYMIPPLNEQCRIVAKVENLMATCDALEAEVAKSRTETDRLMQTILKEAFDR